MSKTIALTRFTAWLRTAFLVVLGFACASANGGQSTPSDQTAQAIQYNINLLQFVAQTKLSSGERSQVAREVTDAIRKAPQNVIHRDGLIATTLTNAAHFPKDAPRLRELWRYDIAANVPHDDIQYILTEKYDPTLVLDKAHQRIVSEETLTALRSCTVWLTSQLHKPPPSPTFLSAERLWVKANYGRSTDDVQDAYAHVARNCAHSPDFFRGVVASKREQFFAQNAKDVTDDSLAGKDAALISRIVYNILLHRAKGDAAQQGRLFDYMVQQSLLQQQLQRSVMKNPPLPPPN